MKSGGNEKFKSQYIYVFLVSFFLTGILMLVQIHKLKADINIIGNKAIRDLEKVIETNKASLDTLMIHFSDKNITIEGFNAVSKKIIESNPNIFFLQHKDKYTYTDMVYPLEGNEKTLGRSLIDRDEVSTAVSSAIRERKVTVNDPYILRNVGEDVNGVIIRKPIFEGDDFQGFFVAVVNLDKTMQQYFSKNEYETYSFNLMDSNDKTFFSSSKTKKSKISTIMAANIEDTNWKIRISNEKRENSIYVISFLVLILLNIIWNIFIAKQARENKKNNLIEELNKVKMQLLEKNNEYELFIDGSNDIVWKFDLENNSLFLSDKWLKLTGYNLNSVDKIEEVFSSILKSSDLNIIMEAFDKYDNQITSSLSCDFKIITSTGELKWFYIRGKGLRNPEGKIRRLLGVITDITERKKHEEQIELIAYYDTLTGLPNKNLFITKTNIYLSSLDILNKRAAIIFIDLDDFKKVNDTWGHNYGDILLKAFSQILKASFREEDVVARFGGDEFIIFMPELIDESIILETCSRVLSSLNNPIEILDKKVNITASMGIVLIPNDGVDINILIKNADTAMYKAKELGKNKFLFFDKNIANEVYRRTEIERELRTAISNNEFELYYQPQYITETLELRGYEALLRWNSKEIGSVRPDEFINIAEKTNQIDLIGKWVLINACLQNSKWINKGIKNVVCVNVSPLQFQNDNFIATVKEALNISKMSPEYLELEITESTLMDSYEKNIETLNILKDMGIHIAFDDFGTGYSSIRYLKMLPCNNLKLDKTLIDDICTNSNCRAIVNGIIKLASEINMKVTVEGIETKEQLEELTLMGCDYLQGYYLGKPSCINELEKRVLKL